MTVKIAINGFGRIGRLSFRYVWDDPSLEIVHVNDICSIESAAYLIQYDSVHGTWDKKVELLDERDQARERAEESARPVLKRGPRRGDVTPPAPR